MKTKIRITRVSYGKKHCKTVANTTKGDLEKTRRLFADLYGVDYSSIRFNYEETE